jgi:ribosome-associated protein
MRNRTLLVDPKPQQVEYDRPSKSQLKRDMTALQDLGRRLTELSNDRLEKLALPDRLRDAIVDYKRITAHEGARRQLQFIGKLMRDVDPAPLKEALDAWSGDSKSEVAAMHLAERWRERLLAEPATLAEFADTHPVADMTRLRTLLRNAAREKAEGRPPRDYRELYRMLREAIDNASPATRETSGEAP